MTSLLYCQKSISLKIFFLSLISLNDTLAICMYRCPPKLFLFPKKPKNMQIKEHSRVHLVCLSKNLSFPPLLYLHFYRTIFFFFRCIFLYYFLSDPFPACTVLTRQDGTFGEERLVQGPSQHTLPTPFVLFTLKHKKSVFTYNKMTS